jgi:large subunit ribosomal protein L7/L12
MSVFKPNCLTKLKSFVNLISRTESFSTSKFYLNATASKPEPIPPPQLDGEKKIYSQKIQSLVNEISKLNLIEVSDLNQLLRQTLNIKDIAMYSSGGSNAGTGNSAATEAAAAKKKKEAEEEAAAAAAAVPVQTKSSFKVKLVKYDETKKVALIKEVKSLNENMNLVQAKKFIESVPQVFKDNIGKDDAEKLKAQLEKVGATCVIE